MPAVSSELSGSSNNCFAVCAEAPSMLYVIAIIVLSFYLNHVAQVTHDDAAAVGNAGIVGSVVAGFAIVILQRMFPLLTALMSFNSRTRETAAKRRHELALEKERTKVGLAKLKAAQEAEANRPAPAAPTPPPTTQELLNYYLAEHAQVIASIDRLNADEDFKLGLRMQQEDALAAKLQRLL